MMPIKKSNIQKILILIVMFLTLVSNLSSSVVIAAADGFPVAPPADSNGLNMRDYFDLSTAKVSNAPVTSRFSTSYPQAVVITNGPNTSGSAWQLGGIWSKNKIDLNNAFTYDTAHFFGTKNKTDWNGGDADGMAFVLQNDPLGKGAFGSPAGGLGVYPWSTNGKNVMISNYVRNALAIEMDSYFNSYTGAIDDQFDIHEAYTPNGHLAVVRPGETPLTTKESSQVGHLQFSGNLPELLTNNNWKQFQVSWLPEVHYTNGKRILGGELTYSLKGNPNPQATQLTFKIDDVLKYFSSDHVYYGYTGATGPTKTFQSAAILKLPQTSKPVTISFQNDNGVVLQDPITLNGEIGDSWDAAQYRPEWIKKDGVWYQYAETYDTNTPSQKDQGTFSETTAYQVVYHYIKRDPPENYALIKQVRNLTTGTDYGDETTGKTGDQISYQLDYTNLTGISNGVIKDQIDPDLDYQKGSLQIANDDTGWQYETVTDDQFVNNNTINFPYEISSGQRFSVRFQTKVKSSNQERIMNQGTVLDNGTNNSVISNKVYINLPAAKELIIKKVAAENQEQPLANAQFKLSDQASGHTWETAATGSDGLTSSIPTDAGERILTLQETVAPAGYSLNEQSYQIKWLSTEGILGVRQSTADPWTTTTTDGLVQVKAGQLVFANQKPGQITVRDFDRTTGKILQTATYSGALGKSLADLYPGKNLPGAYAEREVWGVDTADSLPPSAQLDPYDPQTPPNPSFTSTPQTLTYVFDQKMFELNPDESIEFGSFSQDQIDRTYLIGEMASVTNQTLPFGLAITDRVGVASWQISVRQEQQFQNGQTELTNAKLWFKNMTIQAVDQTASLGRSDYQFTTKENFELQPAAADLPILQANAQAVSGVATQNNLTTRNWRIDFVRNGNGGTSVGLQVPRTTTRQKGRYQTTLTWTASMLP